MERSKWNKMAHSKCSRFSRRISPASKNPPSFVAKLSRLQPNNFRRGARVRFDGKPALRFRLVHERPVMPENHRGRIASFQRSFVHVVCFRNSIRNETVAQTVVFPGSLAGGGQRAQLGEK